MWNLFKTMAYKNLKKAGSMNDLTDFEDFEEEKSTLVLDSTDELKVAGFAKEAYSKGKPA